MSPKFQRARIIVAAASLSILTAISPALGDASPWDGTQRAAVRLIAGAARGGASRRHRDPPAPGWKTYWRYPATGNSAALRFLEIAQCEIRHGALAAPQRLADEAALIGYKHDVVFPLDVVAQDAGSR